MAGEAETTSGSLTRVKAVLIFFSLLLPLALWLLLIAAGLLRSYALSEMYDRVFALDLGMLFGGIGVWTGPIGLMVALKIFRVPDKVIGAVYNTVCNAWLVSGALLWLSVLSARRLSDYLGTQGFDKLENTLIPAAVLLLGCVSRAGIETSVAIKRHFFGAMVISPETIKCAPGGEVAATLKMGKKPLSVEAGLELFREEGGETIVRAASVGPAVPAEGGWTYRITASLPEHTVVPSGGGWTLEVKARGAYGTQRSESADIELK